MQLRSRLRVAFALSPVLAHAQPAIGIPADIAKVPAAAPPSPRFNADAATGAYMAMIPPAGSLRCAF